MNKNEVFVFGSNEKGIHGAGAAKDAVKYHGAIMGRGFGHYGNSFAIPTKNSNLKTLPINIVKRYIDTFIGYAWSVSLTNPEIIFKITRIGCGLAGYDNEDIAPLFYESPDNCHFDDRWENYLPKDVKFWGTF